MLIVVGVIGFPLLFETQPRPIPVDIPIEIPRKDQVPPLVMPPARAVPPRGGFEAGCQATTSSPKRVEAGREALPPRREPSQRLRPHQRSSGKRRTGET